MSSRSSTLPQLDGEIFVTDSGLETDLIFHGGHDLPLFASFVLLDTEAGTEALERYFREHVAVAKEAGLGLIVETPTWRANPDWGQRLGYTAEQLDDVNQRAVAMLSRIRSEARADGVTVVVSGCIGPRGDGYQASDQMSAEEASRYHARQIGTFAATDADLVSALTMTYPDEAIGVTLAAQEAGIPAVISFTVETDGRLPDGTLLGAAIEAVDQATSGGPAYYMVNCAHPSHMEGSLDAGAPWAARLRGVRVNASTKSHAELDEAEELDDGDPAQLAADCRALRDGFPTLTIVGGCCGTDARHIEQIAAACGR